MTEEELNQCKAPCYVYTADGSMTYCCEFHSVYDNERLMGVTITTAEGDHTLLQAKDILECHPAPRLPDE